MLSIIIQLLVKFSASENLAKLLFKKINKLFCERAKRWESGRINVIVVARMLCDFNASEGEEPRCELGKSVVAHSTTSF